MWAQDAGWVFAREKQEKTVPFSVFGRSAERPYEPRTHNSELLTPTSELLTPNSELFYPPPAYSLTAYSLPAFLSPTAYQSVFLLQPDLFH